MRQFTREQLYDLVWKHPITQLAQEFGVSDVAIHKACKKRRIPTPGLGYWAKVQAGQTPLQESLPEDAGPYHGWICFRGNGLGHLTAEGRQSIQHLKSKLKEAPYQMPSSDAPLHPAALRLQKRLAHARGDKDGLIRVQGSGLVALEVSEACKDRAVRLLNALLHEVERQGGTVESGEKALQFRIEGEVISLSLSEGRERIPHQPTEKEIAALARWKKQYQARLKHSPYTSDWDKPKISEYDTPLSGKLMIKIDDGYHWDSLRRGFADGKQQRLEDLIPKIVFGALAVATAKRERRQKDAEEARQRAERARRAEIIERQRALEEKRREILSRDIAHWHQAQGIRAYADRVEAALAGQEDTTEVQKWLRWARREAERLDPLVKDLPLLLQDEGLAELQRAYASLERKEATGEGS